MLMESLMYLDVVMMVNFVLYIADLPSDLEFWASDMNDDGYDKCSRCGSTC